MRDLWYPKDQRKTSHKKDEVFIAARCCQEVKMRSEKKKKKILGFEHRVLIADLTQLMMWLG